MLPSSLKGIVVIAGALLFVVQVPFFGSLLLMLSPLPVFYYWYRRDRKEALTMVATAFLVAAFVELQSQGPNLPVLGVIVLSGILMAEVLKRGFSLNGTILAATMGLLLAGGALFAAGAIKAGIAPWQLVARYVEAMVQENIKIYSQLNLAEMQLQEIRERAPEIAAFFLGIFPALAVSGAVLTVCLNLLALRLLLRRAGAARPDFGDLTLWRAPEQLVWILIGGGVLLLIGSDALAFTGMNLLLLSSLLYLFQGMAIIIFFFRRKRIPPLFRWLIYTLILIQQYLLLFVIALGLFDLWVDFRKRMSEDVPV